MIQECGFKLYTIPLFGVTHLDRSIEHAAFGVARAESQSRICSAFSSRQVARASDAMPSKAILET